MCRVGACMIAAEDSADPSKILRSTPVPDDAGAETADRYEWQAMMATADALSMYFESLGDDGNLLRGSDFAIICEHHEDWAVLNGVSSEIVSGKHREASVGPISTFRELLGDGGVLHLFNRWQALGKTPLCRLVTTGGLNRDGAKVRRACEQLRGDRATQDSEVVNVIAGLTPHMATLNAIGGDALEPPSDVVRAFLAALTFQDGQARRDHLPDMAAQRFGHPVAERLGRADAAGAVWQATLAVVRPRMRAAGPARGGALPTVLRVHHDDPLASRTLTLADVDLAVKVALAHTTGYTPLPRRIIKANRMAVKMAKGGCSDNSIERADDLRLQYRQYWRARRGQPNIIDERRLLNNTLSRVVDEMTATVRLTDVPWGAELWHKLGDRFRAMEGHADAKGLDVDLLLGGVSDLADRCRTWYTDRFDADECLRQLIAERAVS